MSKGRRFNSEKKSKNNILFVAIEILLAGVMLYSGGKIYNWYKDNQHNDRVMGDISQASLTNEAENKGENESMAESKVETKIDFKKLKEQNKDTVGWIKINGTNIDYPVVKGEDNSYYLTHSFDKSVNNAGWVFADYRNKFDTTDKNIIIYAHNRKDKSMFGTLRNVLKKEWYENPENLKAKFTTENQVYDYEVFSIYRIEAEDYYIQTNFDHNSFLEFLNTIKKRSIKDFGGTISCNEEILTLSTCDVKNNYRVVLHLKKC